jgi:hypothetical protein
MIGALPADDGNIVSRLAIPLGMVMIGYGGRVSVTAGRGSGGGC